MAKNSKFLYKTLSIRGIEMGMVLERIIRQFAKDILVIGDVAIDGGAYIGLHTLLMAKLVGSTGGVHAIEPSPYFEKLRANMKNARLENVVFHNLAISNYNGTSEFNYVTNEPCLSSLNKRAYPSNITNEKIFSLPVTIATLDSLIEKKETIKFIKLDIEGAEYHALLGAKEIIRQSQPPIILELGFEESAKCFDYEMSQFFDFFKSINYSLVDFLGNEITPEYMDNKHRLFYGLAYPINQPQFKTKLIQATIISLKQIGVQLPESSLAIS